MGQTTTTTIPEVFQSSQHLVHTMDKLNSMLKVATNRALEYQIEAEVSDHVEEVNMAEIWTKAQLPLRVVGGLIVLSLVATVYSGVLSTINSIPLVPGLLELAGVIWLVNFALRNLIRNSDRDNFIKGARSTWTRVTGRSS